MGEFQARSQLALKDVEALLAAEPGVKAGETTEQTQHRMMLGRALAALRDLSPVR
jgi:hypothetical protein